MSWEIRPGEAIGPFRLGMTQAEVESLQPAWKHEKQGDSTVLRTDDMGVWFDDDVLTKVVVYGDADVRGPFGLKLGASLTELRVSLAAEVFECFLLIEGENGLFFDVGLELVDALDDAEVGGTIDLPGSAPLEVIGVHSNPRQSASIAHVRLI